MLSRSLLSRQLSMQCLRAYSSYSPHYIDPVISEEKQKALRATLPEGKWDLLPTKAALNSESTSIFYHDKVAKLTNYITKGGNKKLARELVERCFENIKRIQLERYNLAAVEQKNDIITDPVSLLVNAIENCRPLLTLTPIKRGGVRYQVPVPVTEKHSYFLSMKWLLEAGKEKEKKVHLPEKLAWEILDAAAGQGRVVKRKNDLHRQCEANRAYAHYRWS